MPCRIINQPALHRLEENFFRSASGLEKRDMVMACHCIPDRAYIYIYVYIYIVPYLYPPRSLPCQFFSFLFQWVKCSDSKLLTEGCHIIRSSARLLSRSFHLFSSAFSMPICFARFLGKHGPDYLFGALFSIYLEQTASMRPAAV